MGQKIGMAQKPPIDHHGPFSTRQAREIGFQNKRARAKQSITANPELINPKNITKSGLSDIITSIVYLNLQKTGDGY